MALVGGEELTRVVIGAAMAVHRALGPGLLESAYEACLAHELTAQNVRFEQQWPLPITYRDIRLDCGYRVDFLVEDQLIVELKSVESLDPIHTAQVLTCLRLSRRRVALLINFNVEALKQGIRRLVLDWLLHYSVFLSVPSVSSVVNCLP